MNRLKQALGGCERESITPLVRYLVETVKPASVVDYGCGDGAWLAEFREEGVEHTVGIDRSYRLKHDVGTFVEADLASPSFDNGIVGVDIKRPSLALCLEVAEHLPESSAMPLVRALCQHDVVAFSAAIPGQGGWGHVNEQWQSWWELNFAICGFKASIDHRPIFWRKETIPVWYRQNLVIYRKTNEVKIPIPEQINVVHPDLWARRSIMSWLTYWRRH